jgi:hypothetical protein
MSSDLKQINTALERLFNEEGQRIVFWNDPDKEFQNTLPFLMLDGVTTLRLDEAGALEAQIRLERDEPRGKVLRYAPTEEPDKEDDCLFSSGKQQAELLTFEETLKHAADQKISLDLDDGVKVNYGKFGDLLAESKAITGGKDEE